MLEIVQIFAERGYQVAPDALEMICSVDGEANRIVECLLGSLNESTVVVSIEDVKFAEESISAGSKTKRDHQIPMEGVLEATDIINAKSCRPSILSDGPDLPPVPDLEPRDRDICGLTTSVGLLSLQTDIEEDVDGDHSIQATAVSVPSYDIPVRETSAGSNSDIGIPGASRGDAPLVEVQCDITGRSTCVGEYQDFVRYFRDRYGKLREMLSRRLNARPIESLGRSTAGRDVSIIGMVMEIRSTGKGNRVVELEDTSGMVTVLFQKSTPEFDQAMHLVTDEVVGVTGTSDGNGRIFAKSLVWPDLQTQPAPLAPGLGGALLTSDLHIGSKYFLEDAWLRFMDWLDGGTDDPAGIASGVRYIVIAGDLVDGIGVYPGQEPDLAISDIYEQYAQAAEYISQIPSKIRIVISPGNHDIVRQAEPQPALPEDVRALFSKNVTFVGNPAWVNLGGISSLVYHGRSIDDLVMKVPGLSYKEPEKAMVEMLRRRHLSPIYGNRVSIAPEAEDHYVIERPPAILHSGHVHIFGVTRYKGVTTVNSGTWQSQTEFQKKMNIQPTPAIVPHIDLSTMRMRKLIFD